MHKQMVILPTYDLKGKIVVRDSQRRNQPIQLPIQCSHQCTPQ
jgi:hypothetical protein